MKTIYIAGPVTGDPDYRKKFFAAETYLAAKGWIVLNPAHLPSGMEPEKYLPICLAMVEAADAVILLNSFTKSDGAMVEYRYAEYQKKELFGNLEHVPILKEV